MPANKFPLSSGIGPEGFDLIKEYLQSNEGQDIDIQQLLNCVSGELAAQISEPCDQNALLGEQEKNTSTDGVRPNDDVRQKDC